MVDEPPIDAVAEPAALLCPWCAAAVPPDADLCPACRAQLRARGPQSIPGVTEIDALALARRTAPVSAPSLGSILMGGVDVERPTSAELPAIAPPDQAVRREMLRLEFDARRAELENEAEALAAEERLRLAEAEDAAGRSRPPGGLPVVLPMPERPATLDAPSVPDGAPSVPDGVLPPAPMDALDARPAPDLPDPGSFAVPSPGPSLPAATAAAELPPWLVPAALDAPAGDGPAPGPPAGTPLDDEPR